MAKYAAIDEVTPLLLESKLKGKKRQTPLPKLQMAIVLTLSLCEPMASHSILPYINQLITELGITGGDERKVGYYAGLVQSLFFATEAATILQWGRVSDRIGRKPVLLLGLAGSIVSVLCFGLSRTFLGLIISRCLCGMLNGNTGVMKSVAGEITDSTNRAQGLALIPVFWNLGVTIAPVIGGSLSRPHERFPTIFSNKFWSDYPYFLPCLATALFTFMSFMLALVFFEETLPRKRYRKSFFTRSSSSSRTITPTSTGTSTPIYSGTTTPTSTGTVTPVDEEPLPLREMLTYPVVISVANHVSIAFLELSFLAILPLFMSMPVEFGGLGCTPATIGYVMAVHGAWTGFVQMFFFAKLVRRFGERQVFIAGTVSITVIQCFMVPFISIIVRQIGVTWIAWTLLGIGLTFRASLSMSFSSIMIYITAASPNKGSLGATNGISQTMASLARAIGPGLATSLYALSLDYNLLGGYAVYVVLFVLSCMAIFLATYLPHKVWEQND